MARKPNYDFERKERERLKNLKTAARNEAKLKARTDGAAPDATDKVIPDNEAADGQSEA